jgi:1-phosphatidylinositol-3-phosphate 5-kinase
VAQLIQKYQDFLPAQGVRDLTKTALAPRPLISESDQEYSTPSVARSSVRTKTRHSSLVKKTSCSDFEQGYAASIAPRYLTHSRRSQGRAHNSRIPGPVLSSTESRCSSRQQSPDNRNANANAHPQTESKLGRASPGQTRPSTAVGGTRGRIKTPVRPAKDKYPARQPSNVSNKSFRRQPGPGSKVSNIAKHFERLNRENERANRRYAVIRGRRARPVVSARAKVEVLDSVKDAIKYGGSGSSESSSEADDEGDDNDECPKAVDGVYEKSSLELPAALPDVVIEPASCPPEGSARTANGIEPPEARSSGAQDPVFPTQELSSLPPSPSLQPAAVVSPSFTPPVAEESAPGATTSFLQTLGTWLQQPGRVRLDIDMDDLIGDPEHIFRDSSMVVRTDEPTSIIALALK